MIEFRTNNSVLCEVLSLKDLHVTDIGSGDGTLVRFMTGQGAHVTGLECGAAQLEKARSYALEGDEVYLEGSGQEMPFDDASYDVAIFFNSLHHVPVENMAEALAEARRVVRPGGTIYVAEPVAAGSGFELHAPIDDETSVRSAAYEAIRDAVAGGLIEVREISYHTTYSYENFAAFKDETIRIDPRRRQPFEAMETDLIGLYDKLGIADEKGMRFEQPMRVNVLERA
ncbi:MAG: class I SAM-dependent methyltransferase [Gammaproteobacteria bacterium]